MWLSIILSFLALVVLWVETYDDFVSDKDTYELNVWTQNPRNEIKKKSNILFRSRRQKRLMRRPSFAFRRLGDKEIGNPNEKTGRRPGGGLLMKRIDIGEEEKLQHDRDGETSDDYVKIGNAIEKSGRRAGGGLLMKRINVGEKEQLQHGKEAQTTGDDKIGNAIEKSRRRAGGGPLMKRIHVGEKEQLQHEKEALTTDNYNSSRVTPMQLVRQSVVTLGKKVPTKKVKKKKVNPSSTDDKDKKKKEEENENKSNELLSVYSLKQTMEDVAKQLGNERNVTVDVLGRTFEYNNIVILKMAEIKKEIKKNLNTRNSALEHTTTTIAPKYIEEVPEKKIIFIVHGLVTMGLLSMPCLTFDKKFMQLLNYYVEHLDKFDIFLIPMANPDGYINSFYSRSWNKNTTPQSSCIGVNLDRNFAVAWHKSGKISSCSQYYPGPYAFSEPETRAIREVFHRYGHKIAAYIHVHAGSFSGKTYKGEAVLYPEGFKESYDDKYLDMKEAIEEIMRNITLQRSFVSIDSLHRWYGKVTGTSVDYAASVFGVPFAMEFVMQIYEDRKVQNAALTTIWKRLIDAIFNFIHKKGETNDV